MTQAVIDMATLLVGGHTIPAYDDTTLTLADDWVSAACDLVQYGSRIDWRGIPFRVGLAHRLPIPDTKVDYLFSGQLIRYTGADSFANFNSLSYGIRRANPSIKGFPRVTATKGSGAILCQIRNSTNCDVEMVGEYFDICGALHNTSVGSQATEANRLRLRAINCNLGLRCDPDNGSSSFSCNDIKLFVDDMEDADSSSPTGIQLLGTASLYDSQIFSKIFVNKTNAVGFNGGHGDMGGVIGAINFEGAPTSIADREVFIIGSGFTGGGCYLKTRIVGIPVLQWGDVVSNQIPGTSGWMVN